MAAVSATLANLINGVSQQPDSQRLPSQVEQQDNAYCTVAEGLFKRVPTEHIKELSATALTGMATATGSFCQFFTWQGGYYFVVITDGDLRVFDATTGIEETVVINPLSEPYLTIFDASSAAEAFRTLAISDGLLILNRSVTVAATEDTTENEDKYTIFVKQGDWSTDYQVNLQYIKAGALVSHTVTETTPATGGSANELKTSKIASDLAAAITAAAGADVTIVQHNSVIEISAGAGVTELAVSIADSKAGSYMTCFLDTVQRITDLPTTLRAGLYATSVVGGEKSGTTIDSNTIKVIGESGGATPYYVQFEPFSDLTSATDGVSGVWVETRGRAINAIDGLGFGTMPAQLTNSGGFWSLDPGPWALKDAGDNDSNAVPHFVGRTISDLFLYKNRIGFVSGDSVCLSEHGEHYNFFRTTVTAVLDSDPINIKIAHPKISDIRSAVVYQNNLILFTDTAQFAITSGDILSPSTVGAVQIAEFGASGPARPLALGAYLFFPFSRGDYSGIREFSGYIDASIANGGLADAADITAHVPKYISGSVYNLVGSTHDDVIAAYCPSNTDTLYVYKYFWSGDQKLQSAWMKFQLGGSPIINGMGFLGDTLYLVVTRPSSRGTHLEKLTLSPGRVDGSGTWLTHLDRRVTEAQCSVSYDAGTNTTTWTLPYKVNGTMRVAYRPTNGSNVGAVVSSSAVAGGYTVTATGDKSSAKVYIGETYTMTVRLSKQYLRRQTQTGSVIPEIEGRLQLKRMELGYEDTGYFRVEVTPTGRSAFTSTMNGYTVAGIPAIGTAAIVTGTFRFPIMARNTEVTVDLINDSHLPSRFLQAQWEAIYSPKHQKV